MEKLDPTFDTGVRLHRQLKYARSLGLGEPDLAQADVVETSVS